MSQEHDELSPDTSILLCQQKLKALSTSENMSQCAGCDSFVPLNYFVYRNTFCRFSCNISLKNTKFTANVWKTLNLTQTIFVISCLLNTTLVTSTNIKIHLYYKLPIQISYCNEFPPSYWRETMKAVFILTPVMFIVRFPSQAVI